MDIQTFKFNDTGENINACDTTGNACACDIDTVISKLLMKNSKSLLFTVLTQST